MLSTFCIVLGGTGLLIALWRNRLWFFFPITCISVHNAVDYIFCRYFLSKTPILMLKPEATIEGFAAGSVACFIYFFITVKYFLEWEWIKQSPTQISFEAFNREASQTGTGPLFESSLRQVNFGSIEFTASPV